MNVVGHCWASGCGLPMVSSHAWKQGVRPEGHAPHGARGLCRKHTSRMERNGTTEYVGPGRNAATGPDQVPIHQCRRCGKTMVSQPFRVRWPELAEKHARLAGQGLCHADYQAERDAGRIERVYRSAEDVLEEWVWLRDDGCPDVRVAAERMGMTHDALDKALYRARKNGDPRGSLVPFAHDMRRAA